jgi:hypothetical protein
MGKVIRLRILIKQEESYRNGTEIVALDSAPPTSRHVSISEPNLPLAISDTLEHIVDFMMGVYNDTVELSAEVLEKKRNSLLSGLLSSTVTEEPVTPMLKALDLKIEKIFRIDYQYFNNAGELTTTTFWSNSPFATTVDDVKLFLFLVHEAVRVLLA